MKIIQIEQGTPEWHTYRASHANASEAGCIMGCSPWKPQTWLQLWRIKTGKDVIETNAAMRRGLEREPITRQFACDLFATNFQPAVVEGGIFSASLDGINNDGDSILEIKNPGPKSKTWAAIKDGIIEPHYQAQVQHQLYVSLAGVCFFVVDNGVDQPLFIEVHPDPEYQELLINTWNRFWWHMQEFSPPEPGENDITPMTGSEWHNAVTRYKDSGVVLKAAEDEAEAARKAIISLCGENQVCEGEGIRARQHFKRGQIDYSCIPELKDRDLEPFRKAGQNIWSVCAVRRENANPRTD